MSHFDDLMQKQEQKEMSAEGKKKADFAGQQAERRKSCYDMADRASKEVISTAGNRWILPREKQRRKIRQRLFRTARSIMSFRQDVWQKFCA